MKVILLDKACENLNESFAGVTALMEKKFEEREAVMERRHQENLQAGRELREQIQALTGRIDQVVLGGDRIRWWK